MIQKAVYVAAKMYQVRDAVRALLGDRYHEQLQPSMEVIRTIARQDQCSELQAMHKVVAELTADGPETVHLRLRVIAAYVEMIEPTPVEVFVPVDVL